MSASKSILPLIANKVESCCCNCATASYDATIAAARHVSCDSLFEAPRIASQPAVVDGRVRVGDWEGDTIMGTRMARVFTLVELKTCLLRMCRVLAGKADTVMRAVVHVLPPLQARVPTPTQDNGSEFGRHALTDIALEAHSYFADSYSSYQRGTSEITHGLIRQYFPKRCDLIRYSDAAFRPLKTTSLTTSKTIKLSHA